MVASTAPAAHFDGRCLPIRSFMITVRLIFLLAVSLSLSSCCHRQSLAVTNQTSGRIVVSSLHSSESRRIAPGQSVYLPHSSGHILIQAGSHRFQFRDVSVSDHPSESAHFVFPCAGGHSAVRATFTTNAHLVFTADSTRLAPTKPVEPTGISSSPLHLITSHASSNSPGGSLRR